MPSEVPKSFTLRGFFQSDPNVLQEFRTLQCAGDMTLEQAWYYLDAAHPNFGIVGGELKQIQVFPHKPDETKEPTNGE